MQGAALHERQCARARWRIVLLSCSTLCVEVVGAVRRDDSLRLLSCNDTCLHDSQRHWRHGSWRRSDRSNQATQSTTLQHLLNASTPPEWIRDNNDRAARSRESSQTRQSQQERASNQANEWVRRREDEQKEMIAESVTSISSALRYAVSALSSPPLPLVAAAASRCCCFSSFAPSLAAQPHELVPRES